MKGSLRQLAEKVAWAEANDDDALPGVLAVPGPRGEGDVAASEPAIGIDVDELLLRVSQVPAEPITLDAESLITVETDSDSSKN